LRGFETAPWALILSYVTPLTKLSSHAAQTVGSIAIGPGEDARDQRERFVQI
jgi:hypothetical protein